MKPPIDISPSPIVIKPPMWEGDFTQEDADRFVDGWMKQVRRDRGLNKYAARALDFYESGAGYEMGPEDKFPSWLTKRPVPQEYGTKGRTYSHNPEERRYRAYQEGKIGAKEYLGTEVNDAVPYARRSSSFKRPLTVYTKEAPRGNRMAKGGVGALVGTGLGWMGANAYNNLQNAQPLQYDDRVVEYINSLVDPETGEYRLTD